MSNGDGVHVISWQRGSVMHTCRAVAVRTTQLLPSATN